MAKAKTEIIDERVSVKQCKLAVEALLAYELKNEQKHQELELLPRKEPNIWLNVTVKKIPPGHTFKPKKIPIAYPLIDPRTTSICLITKDPQREYKDLLEAHNIKFISRVVGIQKLKGKFKSFEARRMLLKENGLFLADDRIIPMLPKLLGVKWFDAKKQPIPVSLRQKDLKSELERAVSSTYMYQNRGSCTSIKVATLSQSPAHILANLKIALPAITNHIYGGWDNIQSLHIKTNSSVSLPIWSCSLDDSEAGRWAGLTISPDEEESLSGLDEDAHINADTDVARANGKKRSHIDVGIGGMHKKSRGAERPSSPQLATLTTKLPSAKLSHNPPAEVLTLSVENGSYERSGKSKIGRAVSTTQSFPQKAATSHVRRNPVSKGNQIAASEDEGKPIPISNFPSSGTTVKFPKQRRHTPLKSSLSSVNLGTQRKVKKAASATQDINKRPKKIVGAPTSLLSRDELKHKFDKAPGEEKKSKVTSIRGRSAKNIILGKKAGQA